MNYDKIYFKNNSVFLNAFNDQQSMSESGKIYFFKT